MASFFFAPSLLANFSRPLTCLCCGRPCEADQLVRGVQLGGLQQSRRDLPAPSAHRPSSLPRHMALVRARRPVRVPCLILFGSYTCGLHLWVCLGLPHSVCCPVIESHQQIDLRPLGLVAFDMPAGEAMPVAFAMPAAPGGAPPPPSAEPAAPRTRKTFPDSWIFESLLAEKYSHFILPPFSQGLSRFG